MDGTRRFSQTTHGEREHEQTPAAIFLETWHSHGEPEVALFRRGESGQVQVHEVLRTREGLLAAILGVIDGQLTTFEQDEHVTQLVSQDPARRFFRVAFDTAEAVRRIESGRTANA